jgi:predicted nicotinamide N-methyase
MEGSVLNHDRLNSSSETKPDDKEVTVTAHVHGTTLYCKRRNLECIDELPDVWLFEPDYTLAASTGFLLWPGSWVVMKHLEQDLGNFLLGKKVIELGSGIGLAGLGCAAAGGTLLLTDLPSVCRGCLDPNIYRNADSSARSEGGGFGTLGSWTIGSRGGSASSLAIDWTEPLIPQLAKGGLDQTRPIADVILAVDVVWLSELLEPFRETCASLLSLCNPDAVLLLTYIDRSSDKKEGSSGQFSSRDEVASFFRLGGMVVETYLTEKIEVDKVLCEAELFKIRLK